MSLYVALARMEILRNDPDTFGVKSILQPCPFYDGKLSHMGMFLGQCKVVLLVRVPSTDQMSGRVTNLWFERAAIVDSPLLDI